MSACSWQLANGSREGTITYAEHIAALVDEHRIERVEMRNTTGRSWGVERRVKILPVAGPVSYALALHEIGHIVAPGGFGRKYSRLDKEMRAWRWAREQAIEWTDRMDGYMQKCLWSYLRRARRHRWPVPAEIFQLVESRP